MEVKQIWLDLRNALHGIFMSSDTAKQQDDRAWIPVENHTLVWKHPVKNNAMPHLGCDSYSFTLETKPEQEWLTKDYDFELSMVSSPDGYYHHRQPWQLKIEVSRRPVRPYGSPPTTDFFPARLPFTVNFGPVAFDGITSGSSSETPRSTFICDGDSGGKVLIVSLSLPDTGGSRNYPRAGIIRDDLRGQETPAVCTARVRRITKCSYLARETSRAAAKLIALPIQRTAAGNTDVIRVNSRERPFFVNLARLTAASSVIAACFRNTTWRESETREFDMTSFSQVKLSHQYGVNRLLLICEVYLVRDLVYCSSVKRLGELAEVALKLELPLLLVAFEIVLKERQLDLLKCTRAEPGTVGPYARILDGLPGFDAARFRDLMVLDRLDLSADGTVIRPKLKDVKN